MSRVRSICRDINAHIPEILEDWKELTRSHPWMALPEEAHLDHLPSLVKALVEACVCAGPAREAREAAVRTALEHGRQRREQGFDDELLFREYHLLREAIWTGMSRRHPKDGEAFGAIARIDAAITVATRGSLEGFHGRDDDALVDQLVEVGPWPADLA